MQAELEQATIRWVPTLKRGRWFLLVARVLVFVLAIALWDLITRLNIVPPIILPPPLDVWYGLGALLQLPGFPGHLWATTLETAVGFLLAAVVGIPLGVLVAMSRLANRVIYPYMVVFQAIPKVALAPIVVTWMGAGLNSKIVLAAGVALFPVLINTILGMEGADENARLLMTSLESSRWQTLSKLLLPTSAPAIQAGLESGLTLSLVGAMAAEFVAAQAGLGVLLIQFDYAFNMPLTFAVMIAISLMGLALYQVVVSLMRSFIDRRPGLGVVY